MYSTSYLWRAFAFASFDSLFASLASSTATLYLTLLELSSEYSLFSSSTSALLRNVDDFLPRAEVALVLELRKQRRLRPAFPPLPGRSVALNLHAPLLDPPRSTPLCRPPRRPRRPSVVARGNCRGREPVLRVRHPHHRGLLVGDAAHAPSPTHRQPPSRELGTVCRLMSFANGHFEMSPAASPSPHTATLRVRAHRGP